MVSRVQWTEPYEIERDEITNEIMLNKVAFKDLVFTKYDVDIKGEQADGTLIVDVVLYGRLTTFTEMGYKSSPVKIKALSFPVEKKDHTIKELSDIILQKAKKHLELNFWTG